MSKTLKFGFIGCGGIARLHASNTKKVEGMEVIAWCDVVKEKADNFLNNFGGKYATENAQYIFDDDEIDVDFRYSAERLLRGQKGVYLVFRLECQERLQAGENHLLVVDDEYPALVARHCAFLSPVRHPISSQSSALRRK